MSGKWPGGFINKTAPTVVGPVDGEGGSASGVWTLDQVADYEKQGLWPKPVLNKELYAWGNNVHGQLGLGDTTSRSSPSQVGALITWATVVGSTNGYFAIGIKTDGTMWSWGQNTNGQLGLGDTTNRSSPVQVGALTSWYQSAAAFQSGAAIKTDGTLWTWGENSVGTLGLNNTTSGIYSPIQVGALTNWAKIASGGYHYLAIKTDGTLWAWGYNNYGQLGQGNTTNYSSPVQVGALTTWLQAAAGYFHTLAVKTDGTLWGWGAGLNGRTGHNNTTNYSSPVQVGGLTNWLTISAGIYTGFSVKTDGTFWTWGYNAQGVLGQGDTTSRSSPVQVGALTNWLQAAAGYQFCIATKTDGSLWAWGANSHGQLGTSNTTTRSSPVQVGALDGWKSAVGCGFNSAFAILKS